MTRMTITTKRMTFQHKNIDYHRHRRYHRVIERMIPVPVVIPIAVVTTNHPLNPHPDVCVWNMSMRGIDHYLSISLCQSSVPYWRDGYCNMDWAFNASIPNKYRVSRDGIVPLIPPWHKVVSQWFSFMASHPPGYSFIYPCYCGVVISWHEIDVVCWWTTTILPVPSCLTPNRNKKWYWGYKTWLTRTFPILPPLQLRCVGIPLDRVSYLGCSIMVVRNCRNRFSCVCYWTQSRYYCPIPMWWITFYILTKYGAVSVCLRLRNYLPNTTYGITFHGTIVNYGWMKYYRDYQYRSTLTMMEKFVTWLLDYRNVMKSSMHPKWNGILIYFYRDNN